MKADFLGISHPCHFVGSLFMMEDSSQAEPTVARGCAGAAKVAFWAIAAVVISIVVGQLH
ncbi:hypothetical protein [Pseudodesulfovibrio sp. zrk46]|uniref:hypothetical protein n=1 Tax=Pseudodesulfovibrio sp. zrk46 TaxID=2725288 RepID=UPI00144A07E7|nr:hypothetical protein [Pseudodesulfovibrio sp. zrk46]QJB55710.1 hypothetical protein HFN16_04535 [Pseudodesulfovibrio sp. zrk46]